MSERKNSVTVDLSAIAHNVRVVKAHLTRDTTLMAVVKADAYGHGALPVARAAVGAGAGMLGVAMPEEGIALRRGGMDVPILVLGAIDPSAAEAVVASGLIQTVCTKEVLLALSKAAEKLGRCASVHIKIDTGMARIGMRDANALKELARLALTLPCIELSGVYTHLATADGESVREKENTLAQIARFDTLRQAVESVLPPGKKIMVHCCNSAGAMRYAQAHYDMVRVGIALYGCPPAPELAGDAPLRSAMRWAVEGLFVKDIPQGATVGYGAVFEALRPMRIMTLPVGYADGLRRALSCGVGQVLVRGKRASIVGRICMDQCMVDVTDIPEACEGDEVVLLGTQGEDCISAEEVALWLSTISYEVLLSPSGRVPRRYIHDE